MIEDIIQKVLEGKGSEYLDVSIFRSPAGWFVVEVYDYIKAQTLSRGCASTLENAFKRLKKCR